MIHDPDVELWTFNDLEWDGKPVQRVGINFGAPGDRRADNGTLWLDWPSVGGPSPDLPLEVAPDDVKTFRVHSSLVRSSPGSGQLPWVAASGIEGVRRVRLTLAREPAESRAYTVRLHFMEPHQAGSTRRVFRVRLQGTEVLPELDIAGEAGAMTALVKEFRGIEVRDQLVVELDPIGSGARRNRSYADWRLSPSSFGGGAKSLRPPARGTRAAIIPVARCCALSTVPSLSSRIIESRVVSERVPVLARVWSKNWSDAQVQCRVAFCGPSAGRISAERKHGRKDSGWL